MRLEGWGPIRATYVVTQIITTVGYGDFALHSYQSQIFIALYAFCVVVVIAYFMKLLMQNFSNRHEAVLCAHLRRMHHWDALEEQSDAGEGLDEAMQTYVNQRIYGALSKVLLSGILFSAFVLTGTIFYRYIEHCTCTAESQIEDNCDASSYRTCVATGGSVMGFSEAFYMSVTTLTGIGFGDYQPRTASGRIFCVVWMFFGVMAAANFVASLSQFFFEGRREAYITASEYTTQIHEREFEMIDTDKNGCLSQAEFLVYTLRKYGNVSEELVEEISKEFDKIDLDGNNAITLEMLMARKQEVQGVLGAGPSSPFVAPLPRTSTFQNAKAAAAKWRNRVRVSKANAQA